MTEERTTVDRARPSLPTGTVTFLFTDIEGSTRLMRADPSAYPAALADHRRILERAVSAHDGTVVDTQGDSFFVAFPSARQALRAAADAQQVLARHHWPGGLDLRVRMGIHTGEAVASGGGYVALPVHRAARIAAVASGGQILVSDVSAALVAGQLPDGSTLRNLGALPLKDFPEPEPLHQLDVAGLPTDFSAPPAPPVRAELPGAAGALLGREDDASRLVTLLRSERTRLVTLTGPGGVGKTRLTLDVAHRVADDFPGGVVFVPLAPVTDPGLVLLALADSLGARREASADVLEVVRTTIAGNRTLVVLDNFEHLVPAAVDVAALLDRVPAVVVLVTSRLVLRLRSEQQFHLSPLAATPAMHLFADRAAAVRPDFVLDDTTSPAVAEICRRLDGLPLAIELAAARVRLFPPEALLARLRDRLDVLGTGPVDLPERQRTLRATMDWSHGLLGPPEQTLFARLAVFSGGWTVAGAETVCGRPGEPDTVEVLSALLDESLVVPVEGGARLDMLETVRAYAAEKLAASDDRVRTERRHTEWVLAMIDPLAHAAAPAFREAIGRFDEERANVRAAVQRAVDAGDAELVALLVRNALQYLARRSGEREALAWVEAALPGSAGAVRGRLLVLRAVLAGVFGDSPAIRPFLAEGLRLLPEDAEHSFDHALAAMADIYAAIGEQDLPTWRRGIDETAARFAAMGHDLGRAFMEMFRGELQLVLGDLDAAKQHYTAVLELAGRLGDHALTGQASSMIGMVLLAQGDLERATDAVLEGADSNRRDGQPTSIAYSLDGLAAVALAEGQPTVAAQALAVAATMREQAALPRTPALAGLMEDLDARARQELGTGLYEATSAAAREQPFLEALDSALRAVTAQRPPP